MINPNFSKSAARRVGAMVVPEGVRYRVWAPQSHQVEVDILSANGPSRVLRMEGEAEGFFSALDETGRSGDAYLYRLDGRDGRPDPASRAQQDDVHGRSLVVDPKQFAWSDSSWHRPHFRDWVIYELHVGTFSQEGTFLGAIPHLKSLRDLGVNAVEIMPVADFPGCRNWGYDGVLPYAPARCYGTPDDFRSLVNRAHSIGLAVVLDVVYNHFGPAGNYLSQFSEWYFNPRHHTPWGSALNFDNEHSGPVREYFLGNVFSWMDEFHIDGFRLDAAHEIPDESPVHILTEISALVHMRGGSVIAEDDRNSSRLMESAAGGGHELDAVWADDFHHAARVLVTGERFSYFEDYEGSTSEVLSALEHGWIYRGQPSRCSGRVRGTPARHLAPSAFVHCISNHDQTGNRAFGERLSHLIPPAAYRALSALLCLTPYTPMLFMGQEWAASTPFLYFTEHDHELGLKITEGRRKEFAGFPGFADPESRENIPDPQSEETFRRSRLNWSEMDHPGHREIRLLYKTCLQLRFADPAFRPADRKRWTVVPFAWGAGGLRLQSADSEFLVVFDLRGGHSGTLNSSEWSLVLSTEEERFGGTHGVTFQAESGHLSFSQPALVVLQAVSGGRF